MRLTAAEVASLKKPSSTAKSRTGPYRSSKARLFAKGRMKAGQMNRTEAAYFEHLGLRQHAGEIAWFAFEPVNLRLGDRCFYAIDFLLMLSDGTLEAHDVKPARKTALGTTEPLVEEDALVKWKIAGETFPFVFRMVWKDGSGWGARTYGE